MSFDFPGSLVLLPSEDAPRRARLLDLSSALGREAARAGADLHPDVRAEVEELVRAVECRCSNLMEGHDVPPRDVDRALAGDLSTEPRMRDLQAEARALVRVMALVDEGRLGDVGRGRDFARTLHREFRSGLPRSVLEVEGPRGGGPAMDVPGEWRTREVVVGRHRPVDAAMVESFMLRFGEGYELRKVGRAYRAIAAAASHHRLLWIHPFTDGNGRVARLHSRAYLAAAGVEVGTWSLSRGLAGSVDEYRRLLGRADWPPQGAMDGRGTLSNGTLVEFVDFFLRTALDQVRLMATLLGTSALLDRVRGFVATEAGSGRLDARALAVLERTVVAGSVATDDVPGLLGVGTRQARRLLEPLARRGLLMEDHVRGSIRITFPSGEADVLFPGLLAPACQATPSAGGPSP